MKKFLVWLTATAAWTYVIGKVFSLPQGIGNEGVVRAQEFAWEAAIGAFLIGLAVGTAAWVYSDAYSDGA